MPNTTMFPVVGTYAEVVALEQNNIPWPMSPEVMWVARVLASDLAGAGATAQVVLTVASAGFAAGRLAVTFTGYGLSSPVVVTADAAYSGASNAARAITLATDFETAMNTAIGAGLAGVVASVARVGAVVTINYVAGIAAGSTTRTYTVAQQISLTFSGTVLMDGNYTYTFSGGGLGSPVVVTTERVGGVPATVGDLSAQAETDIDAAAAGALTGVVQAGVDGGGGLCTVHVAPGVAAVAIATTVPAQAWDVQFGGTPTDGNYVHTFTHSSLPAAADVTTTRAGGTPATNAALSVQAETDIEGDARLVALVETADDDGTDTVQIRTFPGVSGLVVTASAPSPGTLTPTDVGPTLVAADATPAGPAITLTNAVIVDLNAKRPSGAFPGNMLRGEVAIRVVTAFPAGSTATLDDNGVASTDVLDAVAIDAVGWVTDTGTSLGSDEKTEGAWTPRLTLSFGAAAVPTAGELAVQVVMSPLPE